MKWSNDQVGRYGVGVVWLLIVGTGLSGVVAPLVLPQQTYADIFRMFSEAYYQQELNLATSPIANVSHRIFGLAFYVIGMAQFNRRLRAKNPSWHRWCGRLYIAFAALVVVTATILAVRHAFAGQIEQIGVLLMNGLFGVLVIAGLVKARRRNFVAHREYMMRGFAVALVIAVHRPFFGGGLLLFDLPHEALFVISGAAAFSVCMVSTEIWIRRSRKASSARVAGFYEGNFVKLSGKRQ
ncbi:MAG: DUF2306 domain-containing protein [Anaerolineae bacterium]|nr:DUF2306 domain-containing protein [Anaerolineae bacterium]